MTEIGVSGGCCVITGCHIEGGWQNFCGEWKEKECKYAFMD